MSVFRPNKALVTTNVSSLVYTVDLLYHPTLRETMCVQSQRVTPFGVLIVPFHCTPFLLVQAHEFLKQDKK